jgi:multicomponent Na+:H+ antiporter subunit E
MLFLHSFLALAWTAITGELTPGNFALGVLLAYVLLWATRHVLGCSRYVLRVWEAVALAAFVVWEITLSGIRVAYDVVTPSNHMKPGIVAVPLDTNTDMEVFFLASLVTLTPGSLSLDVSADKQTLFVYEMYVSDPDEVRRKIKQGIERRLLKVMR